LKYSLILRPEAEADVLEAYSWYEMEKPGLGDEFLSKIEDALENVSSTPEMHPCICQKIRRKLIRRFPYGIYYIFENGKVSVLGIVNLLRHPRHWRERYTR
jgi:plasmid stabilization system protein ParE